LEIWIIDRYWDIANLYNNSVYFIITANDGNMKWLGLGATNLSYATKLTGSKLANKPTDTQLFYIMC